MLYQKPSVQIFDEEVQDLLAELGVMMPSCHCTMGGSRVSYGNKMVAMR